MGWAKAFWLPKRRKVSHIPVKNELFRIRSDALARFYNGVTLEDIHGAGFEAGNKTVDSTTTVNGIQGL